MKKVKDLVQKEHGFKFNLYTEEGFVSFYGAVNCTRLVFKSFSEVIKIMNEKDPTCLLEKSEKKFILDNSNKEVLCYLCGNDFHSPTDIFVFGDNNIAFSADCFL